MEIEEIEIESFLAIQSCKVSLKELTVFIGPQASGKSIIAKVAYFCRQYIKETFTELAASREDKRQFNKNKSDEFYELFPGADVADHGFSILYRLGGYTLGLSKNKGNRALKLQLGKELEKKIARTRRDYVSFVSAIKDDSKRYFDDGWYSFARSSETYGKMNLELPRVLHIPATRAFFSAVKKNFFTFLSESKTIDPLMVQFGRFLEFAKSECTGEGPFASSRGARKRNKDLESVISGEFIREKDEDLIKTTWGNVALQSSSSGQQEALPLLLALIQYPNKRWLSDLIIIEEPEAHLFPRAQKVVLDMIVSVIASKNCKVVITTHSPYILACVNNHLQVSRPNGREKEIDAACYFIEGGSAEDMFDYEDRLINMSKLDDVSEEIASEYVKTLSDKT